MLNYTLELILSEWTEEFITTLLKENSLCIALFSTEGELLFANNSMYNFFKGEPSVSFINPTFKKFLLLDNSIPLIFEGFITLGDYSSVNTSIWAQVYRKKNNILVLGGVNAEQLIKQNETMHQLNHEISNLQRDLLKEKRTLENTLDQLNRANNELKELISNKDRFISILAHDLKNPFNAILGFLDLIKENIRRYSIEEIERQIDIVNTSANNTYNLLEDLLTWARAQSGKLPYEPQKQNLANIFHKVTENLKHIANNKNITLKHFSTENIEVYADYNMLNTILRNLISNAIKFTNIGGSINLYTEKTNNNVTIIVSDNGIGIDKENQKKLWDFTQPFSKKGTANEKGTGFGLLLCQEFVEKHNGKIWVESELGKGSDFKFTIPLWNDLQNE